MKKVKKAVILAAGYGTRFLPFTKAVSKMMLPIVDTPAIQLIVEECFSSGCEEVLIIVGSCKEAIIKHFSKDEKIEERLKNKPDFLRLVHSATNENVGFLEQTVLDGTGGAVLLAKSFTGDEPFVMIYADDLIYNEDYPVTKQVIDNFYKTGKTIVSVEEVPKEDIVRYSSVEFSGSDGRCHDITRVVEKPKLKDIKSCFSIFGRFVLTPEIYEYVEKVKLAPNGERYFTDAIDLIAREKGAIAYEFQGKRYDTGNKLGYLKAVTEYALRNKELGCEYKDFLKELIKESND